MSAQAQMRAMLDQLMGTSRDGEYFFYFIHLKSKVNFCRIQSEVIFTVCIYEANVDLCDMTSLF